MADGAAVATTLQVPNVGAMIRGYTLSQERGKPCKRHQHAYHLPHSPLCYHPTCLEEWVHVCAKRSNYMRKGAQILKGRDLMGDFTQTLVMRFLDQQAQGKTPMMRPLWIMYEMIGYLRKRGNFAPREVSSDLNEWFQRYARFSAVEHQRVGKPSGMAKAVEDHLQAVDERWETNLDERALADQIMREFIANDAHVPMLVLREDIPEDDAWIVDRAERGSRKKGKHAPRNRAKKGSKPFVEAPLSLEEHQMRYSFAMSWMQQWATMEADDGQ